ncbi:LEA type 2 family protein [Algoriphagus aquimarinus]|uniref:LEA type 2 family protein n=1 Tax=Algoriphagus aquimarinus TaxID=237018 RepID=A0A5C7AZT1_9BACT|nr:LEA type 2 family protein [Algoriphagus aquimarinus]TXE13704.1 LEA type 2 family protein [Algoriphagus aquimarinus]
MTKKILLTILFLIIASLAVFFIWRFVSYKRETSPYKTFLLPRVELSIMEITSLTAEKTEMTVKVLLKNQLPFSFTADSLQYSIFINDVEVIKSHYKKTISLESNDASLISLPLTILNHHLTSILKASERKEIDSVEYRLHATFFTDIVFKKKFDVDVNRLLPLIYIPELTSKHIQVDSLNFSRAAIQLNISIKNQNVFSIKAKNIAYKFAIEDHDWIEGEIPGVTDIKEQSITDLEIPIRLSFKEVGKTLFDLLKNGKDVKYKLDLTFRIDSENQSVKNSKVILKSSGSVKSLLKAVKE